MLLYGALPRIRTETLRLLRPSSLPIGVGGQIKFVSSVTIIIDTIHPCNKLERDSVRHLGFIQSASITGLRRSRQVGVEPKTFYYTVPSKNTE
jgi:hypothetical protein